MLEPGFCQVCLAPEPAGLTIMLTTVSRSSSSFPPLPICVPLKMEERLTAWGCSLPNPAPSTPNSSRLLPAWGHIPQHVYDPSLCARLSCLIFLCLSNSRRTAGDNLMHMKRKQGVANKIKLNLSTFLTVCKALC